MSKSSYVLALLIPVLIAIYLFDLRFDSRQSPAPPTDQYSIRILSHDPVAIYIQNFLSKAEASYLAALAAPQYQRSVVAADAKAARGNVQRDIRNSSSAILDDEDPVVQTVKRRAATFQGYVEPEMIEAFSVNRYTPDQSYGYHHDWLADLPKKDGRPINRISSFFVFLEDACTGGWTHFPYFDATPRGGSKEAWCEVLECEEEGTVGVAVKPKTGNAVFWINLDKTGKGDPRTFHSGAPVISGSKVGMNIWTWRYVEG